MGLASSRRASDAEHRDRTSARARRTPCPAACSARRRLARPRTVADLTGVCLAHDGDFGRRERILVRHRREASLRTADRARHVIPAHASLLRARRPAWFFVVSGRSLPAEVREDRPLHFVHHARCGQGYAREVQVLPQRRGDRLAGGIRRTVSTSVQRSHRCAGSSRGRTRRGRFRVSIGASQRGRLCGGSDTA